MTEHSRLPFSSAYRWTACPGSADIVATYPQTTNPDMEAGNRAHAFAAHCLQKDVDPMAELGEDFQGAPVDAELAEGIALYVQVVRHAQAVAPGSTLAVESRCDARWLHDDLWGTCDAMIFESFGHAVVIDLKWGTGVVVEAKDNPQLLGYAMHPLMRNMATGVTVVIVQPRAYHPAGPIRMHNYTAAGLNTWGEKFQSWAIAASKPNAPLVAGDHCRFCPHAGACPELQKQSLAIAKAEFSSAPPAPHVLTPEQISTVLQKAPMVDAWLRAIQVHALNEAKAGRMPPGFKLVEGRPGNRKWADPSKTAPELARLGIEPYEAPELVSPAEAERRLKAIKGQFPHALTMRNPGAPHLVPESDPKPAISAGPSADFKPVAG